MQKLLDFALLNLRSEIAKAEGLAPARITQMMNLLKLPSEVKDFLTSFKAPKEIRKSFKKSSIWVDFGAGASVLRAPPVGDVQSPQ